MKILTASQEKLYETDEKELEGLHFYKVYLAVKGEFTVGIIMPLQTVMKSYKTLKIMWFYTMHDTLEHIHKRQPSKSERKAPAYGPGKAVEQTSIVQ